jgi:hypothetical protein
MKAQSILLSKSRFKKRPDAVSWIKAHGYKIDFGIDEKPNTYRFR